MIKETMTAHERLDATIAMEPVDRVPVCLMAMFFCARHQGVLTEEFIADDTLYQGTIEKTFDELGGWDVIFSGGKLAPILFSHSVPARLKLPGVELPSDSVWQFDEIEQMTVDEYDLVIDLLLPLTEDPVDTMESVKTVPQAKTMFEENAAWLRENVGEERFTIFRMLAHVVAVDGRLMGSEEALMEAAAQLIGIPSDSAKQVVYEILTYYMSMRQEAHEISLHLESWRLGRD